MNGFFAIVLYQPLVKSSDPGVALVVEGDGGDKDLIQDLFVEGIEEVVVLRAQQLNRGNAKKEQACFHFYQV